MKPFGQFPKNKKKDINYVLTDIDDTLTNNGRLPAVVGSGGWLPPQTTRGSSGAAVDDCDAGPACSDMGYSASAVRNRADEES